MRILNLAAALLLAVPVSTIVVACGAEEDTDQQRVALEREALERELELALQPDTTVEPDLADVPESPPAAEPALPPRAAPPPAAPRREPARTQPSRPAPSPAAPAPASPPAGPRYVTMAVPAGSNLSVRLNEELSTERSSAGSSFTATLIEPVIAADGSTLIPAGATVRGRVTESHASGRAGEQAYLKLAFHSVSVDGRSYPISATAVDVPVKMVNRDSNKEKAAKIGGGAALGAVLGQVIGKNSKSTVAGAAIGAAAGTAVAMGTADVDAVVPEGSRVVIRLDSPVEVEKEVT